MFKVNSKSGFIRSILVLSSGTAIAQLVSYAVTPIITRLFTTEDFGEIGVFLRIVSFLTAIGTTRYELTLPLPKNQNHAFQLFRLSLRISLVMIGVTLGLGMIYWIIQGGGSQTIFYVLMVATTTFFMVFKNIGTNWAIRNQAFNRISSSNILSALSTNGLKLIAGVYNIGVNGLILATALGSVFGAATFILDYYRNKRQSVFEQSKKKMYALSKMYKDFPRVNLPHAMLDATRELLIAFLIVELFSQSFFGSFDLSFRMLRLPLILIGVSLGQVFYNRCSAQYAQKEALFPLLKKTTLILGGLSLIPFSIVFFFGEPLFIWVFGEQWGLAGRISEILAPWLMINFVASPVSTLPMILGKQVLFFWLGLVSTFLQLIGFGLIPYLLSKQGLDEIQLITWISYTMTLFLILITLITLKITKDSDKSRFLLQNMK